MKKCKILINAYPSPPSAANQANRLKEELEARGVSTEILRNNFFAAEISGDGNIADRLGECDFCIYLDKDKYISNMLERCGVRLFNCADAIEACDDKMTTFIRLAGAGIPMPVTLPGLLCYRPEEAIQPQATDYIERRLKYPLIVKMSYGSLGSGVFKADTRQELDEICNKVKCVPHLFQQFIAESCGRDMRVIVIGGKCVAAMIRTAHGDFRSNIELGGSGTPCTPPPEVEEMCLKAAKILNLDYCGIDILFAKDGYKLCEVNSNAFFGGMEHVTGINVGGLYADHIVRTIYKK